MQAASLGGRCASPTHVCTPRWLLSHLVCLFLWHYCSICDCALCLQDRNTWRCISSPDSPAPRGSHQVSRHVREHSTRMRSVGKQCTCVAKRNGAPAFVLLRQYCPSELSSRSIHGSCCDWYLHCLKREVKWLFLCGVPQAVVYKEYMYIFGGEFATAYQYYHHRDIWRFHLAENT